MRPFASLTDAELAAAVRRLPDAAIARLVRGEKPSLSKIRLTTQERLRRIDYAGFGLVFRELAARRNTTIEAVLESHRGGPNVVSARHDMWAHARSCGLSFPGIAALFDVNHTTVVSALRPIDVREARNQQRKEAWARSHA